MFKFLTKLFRKSRPAPQVSALSMPAFSGGSSMPMPAVETAHISLFEVLSKFPADLQASVQQWPDASVKVALPLPTILKQLPEGAVKMSLASVHRQAPPGVFKPQRGEDKRMVEVPLKEIFKRIRLDALKRRPHQRLVGLPENGFNLFGDKENPYAIAPTVPEIAAPAPPVLEISDEEMAEESVQEVAPAVAAIGSVAAPADLAAAFSSSLSKRTAGPKPDASPTTSKGEQPPLLLAIGELAANWPEPIKSEVAAMNGAQVALPAGDVTAGLAKGRVAFTWGQLRSWVTPAPEETQGGETTELVLPLRVVAPAFLKHSKRAEQSKRSISIDEEIPALFHGGDDVPKAKPLAPPAEPEPENAAVAVAEPGAEALAIVTPEEVEAPAIEEATPEFQEEAVVESTPAPVVNGLGALFGQPEKIEWSPVEIVQNVVKLPGVDGAIIALLEGLVVAHHLPEHLRGDIFAAFLPQIFARLNQYTGEMKLGEVDDLVVTTHGAQCQMFRHGEVFFAVLGKNGAELPIKELRLCAQELAK